MLVRAQTQITKEPQNTVFDIETIFTLQVHYTSWFQKNTLNSVFLDIYLVFVPDSNLYSKKRCMCTTKYFFHTM